MTQEPTTTAYDTHAFDADVAIIGYGPAGVTAATYLGMQGVSAIVLEKDADLYSRARAVTVNDWTMRIFQDFGIDDIVKRDMDIARALTWKTYDGKVIFRLGFTDGGLGHAPSYMIYQPDMEREIRRNAEKFDSIDLRLGHAFTGMTQDADGVTITARDTEDGDYRFRVRNVLGTDGGGSNVRKELGFNMIGQTRPRRWLVVDGEVTKWWPECNELVFWSDPERPVVDIPLAKGNHRWEIPLQEGETDADFDTEEKVWARLKRLGIDESNARLKGWAFYSHHLRHLEAWRGRHVTLIGDAAHLMPPWAGQGMQSAIRDAQNAAWKYALVAKGLVGEDILDTIQSERSPHVEMMTEMAKQLGFLIEGDDPKLIKLRNTLGPYVMHLPGLSQKMLPTTETNRFEIGWVTGLPKKNNALGRMIPQPEVYATTGIIHRLDDLLGQGFAVLGLDADPRESLTPEQAAGWERLGARMITVVASGASRGDADTGVDHTGTRRRWLTKYGAKVVVLRPDRFVAAADPTGLDVPAARGNLEYPAEPTSAFPQNLREFTRSLRSNLPV